MEIRSFFEGGVDRDTAPHRIAGTKVRALTNFRAIGVDGQGYILVNVRGNELQFSLSEGFMPLGSVDYNGIAFIVSYNPSTGMGEIGTYPSPLTVGTGGFEHVYRPLNNWTAGTDPEDPGAIRQSFRTTLFGFQCDRQCEVEACESFDGSVNLYIADWKNPLRVVNTGFEVSTGVYNDRQYWTGNFANGTDAFFESCPHPVFSNLTVQDGGAWRSGNTIFHLRYRTAQLDATSFLSESRPAEIFADSVTGGVSVDGADLDVICNKSIVLDLTGIDATFAFVEVAFVRWTGSTYVTGLIDTLYPIPAGGGTMQITVTGAETIIDITADELIARKSLEDSPRSITQFERRLWGGNWKGSLGDLTELRTISEAILIRPCDPDEQHEIPDQDFRTNTGSELQFKQYQNLRDFVGYFRGEPYAFSIIWVLTGGKESQPYPIQGYDAWLDPGATTPNTRGILRMPSNMSANYAYLRDRGLGNGQMIQTLGVKLDVSAVVITPWIAANVCGFYLVRAERKPQIAMQGHVANCWFPDGTNGDWFQNPFGLGPANPGSDDFTTNWIPEFRQSIAPDPTAIPVPLWTVAINSNASVATRASRKPSKFGLFSSQHFFSPGFTNGDVTLLIQGRSVLNMYDMSTPYGGGRDPYMLWEQRAFTPGTNVFTASNYGPINAVNVAGNTYAATGGGFVSKFAEGSPANVAAGIPFFFNATVGLTAYYTRDMKQRNYIGLATDGVGGNPTFDTTLQDGNTDVAVVNIYRIDPTTQDITTIYDPRREFYSKISEFVPLSDLAGIGTTIFYRGDCFIARTYHRHLSGWNEHDYADSNGGVFYRYGLMAGLVQEMPINTSMRRATNLITYYPELASATPGEFAFDYNGQDESAELNAGYNKVLGLYARLGFDVNLPAQGSRFPVRIKYSAEQLEGSFEDGYRKWSLQGFRDFDRRMGQITRITVESASLMSIQETGLNFHYINDRVLIGDGQGGSLVLGEGEVLSPKFRNITDKYGSQHQWSIVRSIAGVQGYDQRQRSMWRVTAGGFEELDARHLFKADVVRMSELLSDHSDIIHRYPDAPVCTGGVVGWFDRKYGDVGWTFLIPTGLEDCPMRFGTLVFNEKKNEYAGERSHNSPFYFNIAEDFYSTSPAGAPWAVADPEDITTAFHLHDSKNVGRTVFYGAAPFASLEFITNQPQAVTKTFDACAIIASGVAPTGARARTDHQFSSMDPFLSTDPWKTPEYKEQAWHIPFLIADSVVGGQDMGVGSSIRGNWCSLEVTYRTPLQTEIMGALVTLRPVYN